MAERVLGVDACKAGWVGVVLDDGAAAAHVAKSVAALVAAVEMDGDLAVIGIDIPIGLADTGRRGVRVFSPPSWDAGGGGTG
jgi:predicted RNase H-like nuclease